MPAGETGFPGEVAFGVEEIDGLGPGAVLHIEGAAGQRFVEISSAPRRDARRGRADQGFDVGPRHGIEDLLQNGKIQGLMTKYEGQMVGKSVAMPVPSVEDGPGFLPALAAAHISVGDAAWCRTGA